MNPRRLSSSPTEAREARKEAMKAVRRERILDAARQVFAEHGLEKGTMRRIADACGYTPAAIYFYFHGKEEIYGALLMDVLAEIRSEAERVRDEGGTPTEITRRMLEAFFAYYQDRPREFELSYYLYQGVRPQGLTEQLDRELNRALNGGLSVVAGALQEAGNLSESEAWIETVASLAHLSGIALLANTGRTRTLHVNPNELAEKYIDELMSRLSQKGR